MEPDGFIETNWDQVIENFDDMQLKEPLLRGIYAYGFEKPSAIQQRAIVPCCQSKTFIKNAKRYTSLGNDFEAFFLKFLKQAMAPLGPRRTTDRAEVRV